ncbi:MAG: ribonuclease catalytic domain-containing protein [Bacilli bacterium]
MQKSSITKIENVLKCKQEIGLQELCKLLEHSEKETRKLLLNYLNQIICKIKNKEEIEKYMYLFKIFNYLENIENVTENDNIIISLENISIVCLKRLKENKKNNKVNNNNKNIFSLILDKTDTTVIKLKQKELPRYIEKSKTVLEILNNLIYNYKNYNKIEAIINTFLNDIKLSQEEINIFFEELIDKYTKAIIDNNQILDIIHYQKIIKLCIFDLKLNIDLNLEKKLISKLEETRYLVESKNFNKKNKKRFAQYLDETIKNLEKKDVTNDINQLKYKYNILPNNKHNMLNEPNDTQMNKSTKITDCKNKYTFTIDEFNTWAFDDACSLEKLENGNYLLGIYVADVTTEVPRNSNIDILARKMVQTTNFNRSVVTMLPTDLINKLTLKKNEDRMAIGSFFELDNNLNCINYYVERCIINVDNNYSYDTVDCMLTDSKQTLEINTLKNIVKIAKKFQNSSNLNTQYRLSKKLMGEIICCEAANSKFAHTMISDLMVQYNFFIANYFSKQLKVPFIYRVNIYNNENILPFLKECKSAREVEKYLSNSVDSSIYSVENLGHKGLCLPSYCHATNPLRNYSSLENERLIIEHMIDNDFSADLKNRYEKYKNLCEYMNNRIELNKEYIEDSKKYMKNKSCN